MKKIKWIIGLLLLIAVIFTAYILYNNLSKDYVPDRVENDTNEESYNSYKAPDFTVLNEDLKTVKLSDFKGTPVVINLWASWCPPCKSEMPDFEKAYKEYKDEITFMMVNMTDGERETIEKARTHILENNYTFPVYYDTMYSAATAYQAVSLPATYFIDKDGNLVTYAQGMIDLNILLKGIGMLKGEE